MPSNWLTPTKPVLASKLFEVLPSKVAFICEEILSQKKRLTIPGPLNRFVALLGKLETLSAKEFGKKIEVTKACIHCEKCARECPVGNIEMREGIPHFGESCIMCMSCLYTCPVTALVARKGSQYVIKEGFSIKKMEASPSAPNDLDIAQEAKGVLLVGLARYLLNKSDTSPPSFLRQKNTLFIT